MKGHPKDFLYHHLRNSKNVLLIIGISTHERSHAMKEKSNYISKSNFGIDVRVMVDQHAILNLLIRKGLIDYREFKIEVDRINEEIRKSFVN